MTNYLQCIKLNSMPKNHWKDKENLKNFIELLAKHLKYKSMEDWYKISQKQIKDFGGSGFLGAYYEGSAIKFVKDMYPDYDFKEWLFNIAPQGYWKNIENVKLYMNWLYIQKSFNSINDWYKLEQKDFFDYSGRGLYSYYNCYTLKILEDTYPNIEWYGWLFRLTPNGFWNYLENNITIFSNSLYYN